ncbi:MAG: hypothetical protein OEV59_05825 [Deltaproteobacteria bacterium]|nr:hypothetical protein [Deltaproteobacteria bacterium]
MKSFIFTTAEGYTFSPNSKTSAPDIENCQVLGFAEGASAEDAFDNLIKENSYLTQVGFDILEAYELKQQAPAHFSISKYRKKTI